ncbi:MAG: response regulator [Deltaproteobacteria bacterium]|nr:response regulator [Nannocystaceae bacterium]
MSGTSILVVDDNPTNTKLLTFILSKRGYDVSTAHDAEQALELLAHHHPRLILMDVQLPGMDGLALTRLLKSDPATRDILIIAVTAAAMKGDEDKAREAGCDGYITKPIDIRDLAAQVRTLLERSLDREAGGEP